MVGQRAGWPQARNDEQTRRLRWIGKIEIGNWGWIGSRRKSSMVAGLVNNDVAKSGG